MKETDRRGAFRSSVDALLKLDQFWAVINSAGFSPWVHLIHTPARRAQGGHRSGSRARITGGNDLTTDPRVAVLLDGNAATFTPLSAVWNYQCGDCGARITVSEWALLEAVTGALMRDTRDGRQFVAKVR